MPEIIPFSLSCISFTKENIIFGPTFMMIGFLQDTLKSSPPENKVMKRATLVGISTTTLFYVLCGCIGYAAFGNNAPGNFLTGFGFYEPFWLIDFANACIAIHLIGAYQVYIYYHTLWVRTQTRCLKIANFILVLSYQRQLPYTYINIYIYTHF